MGASFDLIGHESMHLAVGSNSLISKPGFLLNFSKVDQSLRTTRAVMEKSAWGGIWQCGSPFCTHLTFFFFFSKYMKH